MIEALAGTALAVLTLRRLRISRWAQHRFILPLLIVLIALVYVGFAFSAHSSGIIMRELMASGVFLGLALLAYFGPLWVVASALVLHGGYDLFHDHFFENPGVPSWYPVFCAAYDGVLAALILINRSKPE